MSFINNKHTATAVLEHIRDNCTSLVNAIMSRATYASTFEDLRISWAEYPTNSAEIGVYSIELDIGQFQIRVASISRRDWTNWNPSHAQPSTVPVYVNYVDIDICFKYPHIVDSCGNLSSNRQFISRSSRARSCSTKLVDYDFSVIAKAFTKNAKSLVKVIEADAPVNKTVEFFAANNSTAFANQIYPWSYSVPMAFLQELKVKFPNMPKSDLEAIRAILTKNNILPQTVKL